MNKIPNHTALKEWVSIIGETLDAQINAIDMLLTDPILAWN
jgi:hypothetical protein